MAIGDNDDVIDSAVVRIGPDLSGFRKKLERDLNKQLAGVRGKIPVELETKTAEFQKGANYVAGLRLKYNREQEKANLQQIRGLRERFDMEQAGIKATQATAKKAADEQEKTLDKQFKQVGKRFDLQLAGQKATEAAAKKRADDAKKAADAEDKALGAEMAALGKRFALQRAGEEATKKRLADEKAAEKARLAAAKAAAAEETRRNVSRQRADETYLNFQRSVGDELAKIERDRALDEITIRHDTDNRKAAIEREASKLRIALLGVEERAEKAALQESEKAEKASLARRADARKSRKDLLKQDQLIDYGGKGIKPMNLLYGVVTAMTPALFAMGTSAVQASTSIAALGSAGIGAALGLSGVLIAFQGIGDVLNLRKTVLDQETASAANSAQKAVTATDDLAKAERDLADAQRDQKTAQEDIHKARVEATRDLEKLRQAVIDLDNEYKSDTLSVAEAKQNAEATDRNFFATALEKARAHQDLRDAQTKLGDTALERKEKKEDLKTSVSKGVEGSEKVRDAKDRSLDAIDRTKDARLALTKQRKTASGVTNVSSAAANLAKKIKELSPAGQEMYHWFEKNEGLFKRLRNEIQQKTLPGFNKFLKAVTYKPRGGKSTLEIAADYAGDLGAIISKYAGKLGIWTNSPLFRKSMAKIQETNAKAFDNLGQALLNLADPITRILEKAAPGFESLSDTLLELSERFSDWIEKLDESGALAKWFEDSRTEAGKWYRIAKNILTLLKNLFTAALPAGGSLVSSFEKFTKYWADWSSSPEGTKQINDFFDKIKNLPYAQIIDFFKNAAIFFAGFRAYKYLKALNPFLLAITAFAAANPQAAANLLERAATAIGDIMQHLATHPKEAALLLALLATWKLKKALGINLKLPIMDRLRDTLTSKFKILEKFTGGAKTATMTVHAGVVNIHGKVINGGGGIDLPDGKDGKTTKGSKLKTAGKVAAGAALGAGGGLAIGAEIAVALGAFFSKQQHDRAKKGEDFLQPFKDFAKDPGVMTFLKTLQMASPVGLAAYALTSKKKTAMGKESDAFQKLKADVSGYNRRPRGIPAIPNDPSVVNRAAVREYLDARKRSVDALVEETKKTKSAAEAKIVERRETQATSRTLSLVLQQYGWSKKKADDYSDAISGLNTLNHELYMKSLTAKGGLAQAGAEAEKTGKKARTAAEDVATLKEKLDKVSGKRIIELTVQGKTTAIKDLEQVAVYQQLIRQGKAPTEANIRRQKAVHAKSGGDGGNAWAQGGQVTGYSPHPKADNIPAWLTADEYVHPVAAVKHYGTDFMEAVRTRQFPRYADGGSVQRWPFPAKVPENAADVVDPRQMYYGIGGGKASGSIKVAELAEKTARAMGASQKQLIALMAAGLVESGMRSINYGDRDSVGFLQQRPSQGWGSAKQLLDPAYATRKFIQAARRMDSGKISAGELAARVQRPRADLRYKYGTREADAVAILNRMAPFINVGMGTGSGGSKSGLVAFGRWLQVRGYSVTENPSFGGVHAGHVPGSWHYKAGAIDVNRGAGTSKREQKYLAAIIPEARRRGFNTIFMAPGHYDHAHVDIGKKYADGGLVPAKKYDSGGVLPPGYTLAFNGTGANETIRTAQQERGLQGPLRLDRRDLVLLAGAIRAGGTAMVNMDGRKVAELTNQYNYLPAGV